VNVSLPVQVFDKVSGLERFAQMQSYAPYFFETAANL